MNGCNYFLSRKITFPPKFIDTTQSLILAAFEIQMNLNGQINPKIQEQGWITGTSELTIRLQ